MNYREFFKQATGNPPYDYQVRLAEADPWPDLLEAPTGGKSKRPRMSEHRGLSLSPLPRRRVENPKDHA